MTTLPGTPEPNAVPPDVDSLFLAKSVDELFPPEVERDRYRRQTLGTSPIQDMIFGNTEVNPVARVLDAFGQGFKSGWGSEPAGLSQESADYLKKAGVFNDYDKGQKSVIKAANESLMRPAAVGLDAVVRSFNAAFTGGQAAVAKVGEEAIGTPVDKALKAVGLGGTEQLGRDVAAVPEAFMGSPHPTGMPHVDLVKAKSLKVIGEGEEGYFGTAPGVASETTAPVATPKPVTGMPVDLFIEPRDMSAPETKPSATPVESPKASPEAEQPAPGIATDVAGKLVAAGRPEAEASASGQIIASHYQARAERFNGERGTAEELYNAEGADIRPGEGAAPTRSEIKPTEPDAGAVEAQPKPLPGDAGAAEPVKEPEMTFDQIKRGKIVLRGDARPIITLFKDANASTFIHETGHQWLEELMRDADHPKAPNELRDDADTVRNWLGVHSAEDIKTSHHEKFARGFERYMMEGKAPTQALAGVFAKFRDWLTRIYQTVTRLKSPINDEIRGVFDRLLTTKPEDVKIEPETPAKSFADIHEADAEHTPPEMAHPAAETITAERDSVAARHLPEDQNARLEDVRAKAERLSAGDSKPDGHADAARSSAGEAGNAEASGAERAGGIEAAPESTPAPKAVRTEPPVSAHDKFPDKAGNIRLDNLNTPEELNQIIRQTAEDNGDFQNVRGPVSDAQVLDLAEAAGVDAAFIDSRKLGEAWTAPQIVALRRLLIQSAQSVHDLAGKAAIGTDADVMAYAEAKARHQLIQERVSSVTAEAGRALRAFQSKFTDGVAGDVSSFLKDATGKTLFQLQQEAKFLSKLQTPQQTSKFINDTSKGTFRNAILEYYINALISGPVTHTRYIVSNAVNAIFTPIVEIPFAAASRVVREVVKGEPVEGAHFGEAGAQLYGLIKGSRDGLSAAIEAFKSGVSPALPNEKISAHFAEASHAIPGTVGQVLRIPSRSVAGIHSFFKALRYEQNVQALAYREAANAGLKGDAFTNRVAELTTSPTEAMMTDATNNALKELYMSPTDYHSKMGGLVRFTNQNLAAKIVVPFMKIGSQITRNAFMERTPLGLFDRKVRSSLSGELGGGERDLQAGKITAGIALMATSVGLMAEGMMTGDGPEEPAKRAVWLLSHTPASIQIGDINFKYGNTGPLGMLMRFAANTYETAEHMGDKDMSTLAVSFFEGFAKSVLDETFLRGVKDALDAMFHPKEYGGRYIKSQITNWMPWSVGMSQVARKVDPFQRETHGIWQAAQAKIPYLSESLMPRRDMFGEPMPNGGPLPDYASDPVVKAMDDLHIGVGKIGKKIRGIDLTEQQYDDLSRIAGRSAKMKLNAMVNIISNPNVPPDKRIELIHNAISGSREDARTWVMMRAMGGPDDIVKKATDAKRAQLRLETTH